jgi:hypothetical protein
MTAKTLALTAIVALAGLAVPAPSAVAADDFKFVAPADCIPYAPNTTAAELQLTTAGVFNPGSTTEQILCPLPRDQEDPYQTGEVDIVVYYRGLGPVAARVSCTLYVGSPSMQSTAIYTKTVQGPLASGGTRTNLTIAGAGHSPNFYSVPVSLLCSIGPNMSVAGVFFNESGPTHTP